MIEKRKVKRKRLPYYLRVFDAKTNEPIGDASNISTEGMMLISNHPIATYATYRLKMVLPTVIPGKEYLEFSAESRWWEKGYITDTYNVGFQFKDISKECSQTIDRLMKIIKSIREIIQIIN